MFGVMITDCIYDQKPKTIGRSIRKKTIPAKKSQKLDSVKLFSEEISTESIIRPSKSAADTSIIPAEIERIPEMVKTGKLPFKAH